MKTNWIRTAGVLALSVVAIACGDKNKAPVTQAQETQEILANTTLDMQQMPAAVASSAHYKKGDVVPNELVCMVNDAYMGKKQLEVMHEGKMYYGCCAMCQSRIPENESIRVALDPLSLETVDKAEAYIVIIGHNGEVAYFKNEENYRQFVVESSIH